MSGGDIVLAIVVGLAGYSLGAVSFAIVVGKWIFGVDVREHGSGNVGTTNTMRVLGWKAGLLVLAGDMLKGLIPALVAVHLFHPWLAVIIAVTPVVGHMYSMFLRGSGGKGVATGAGVVLALMWQIFVVIAVVWLALLVTVRMVSFASICAATLFPVLTFVFSEPLAYRVAAVLLSAVVVWAHRGNIRRIAMRCEHRVTLPWARRHDQDRRPEVSQR
jgi:glycerol-3-phosphate acyltransferase PlsY